MKSKYPFLKTSLLLSSSSFLLAVFSAILGQQVNYLEYLQLFNTMGAVMLSLGIITPGINRNMADTGSERAALVGECSSPFSLGNVRVRLVIM